MAWAPIMRTCSSPVDRSVELEFEAYRFGLYLLALLLEGESGCCGFARDSCMAVKTLQEPGRGSSSTDSWCTCGVWLRRTAVVRRWHVRAPGRAAPTILAETHFRPVACLVHVGHHHKVWAQTDMSKPLLAIVVSTVCAPVACLVRASQCRKSIAMRSSAFLSGLGRNFRV